MLDRKDVVNFDLNSFDKLEWSEKKGPFHVKDQSIFVQYCTNLPKDEDLKRLFWKSFWNLWGKHAKYINDNLCVYPSKPSELNNYLEMIYKWSYANEALAKKTKELVSKAEELKYVDYLNGFPYQVQHVINLRKALRGNRWRALDGSDTGTGKTYTALDVCKEENFIPIVICPRSVIYSWTRAMQHFDFKGINSLEENTPKVVNYECIKTGKMILTRQSKIKFSNQYKQVSEKVESTFLRKSGSDFIWMLDSNHILIFDEIQYCKNKGTINTDLLISASKNRGKILGLSATAAENTMKLYAIGYMLNLFDSPNEFWDWSARYGCGATPLGWDFKGDTEDIVRLHHAIFPSKGARMAIADLGDMFPENQILAEAYNMEESAAIEEAYEAMEEELALLEERVDQDNSSNVLTAILRARQRVELLKVPTFVELVQDYTAQDKSIALFVSFNQTIDSLAQRLHCNCIIRGGQSEQVRQENIERFQKNESSIIICNINAGGVGISLHDLKGGHPRISLISPTYSAQTLIQAVGRIWRAGGKSKSIQRIIFAEGTREMDICEAVKKRVQNINLLNDGDLTKGIVLDVQRFNNWHKLKSKLLDSEKQLENGTYEFQVSLQKNKKKSTSDFKILL